MEDYYTQDLAKESLKNKELSDENMKLKEQLSKVSSELKLLKEEYFFYQDDLYIKYIFGDKLPNIAGIYKLLKDNNAFRSNWGSFCYCFTYSNAINPNPQKLEFNLQNSDMTYKDIGLILYQLNTSYKYENEIPFISWMEHVVKIISKHGNILESKDEFQIFVKKNYRPYKKTNNLPKFYNEIINNLAELNKNL